jgi:hypothetical protein
MQGRNRTTEVADETYRANKRALPAAVATPGAGLSVRRPQQNQVHDQLLPGWSWGHRWRPAFPAVPPGGVTGDLAGDPLTDDCSA